MSLHTAQQLAKARKRTDLKFGLSSIFVYETDMERHRIGLPLNMKMSFKNLLKHKRFFNNDGSVNREYWNKVSSYIQDVFGYKQEQTKYEKQNTYQPQFRLTPEQHLIEILYEREDRIRRSDHLDEYLSLCMRCGERSANGLCYCTKCHWGIMESLGYYEREVARLNKEMDE